jgi:cell division protein FtsA
VEAPRFATVVGLAQYGAGRMAAGGAVASGRRSQLGGAGVDKIASRVKTWLQDFF